MAGREVTVNEGVAMEADLIEGAVAPELFDRRTVEGTLLERVPRSPLAAELDLLPHPEGGWYRRTWTSPDAVTIVDDKGHTRIRPAATLILFLLPTGETSAWHRVASTEVWIWNGPGPLLLQYGGDGEAPVDGDVVEIGDSFAGLPAQALIPGGVWQRTLPADHDVLVSCMVSPGFDFADFSMSGAP